MAQARPSIWPLGSSSSCRSCSAAPRRWHAPFPTAYTEIARKNGKSTLAAGIALYLFAADGEGGAEVYASATKREQARIVWSEAKRMVQSSPALRGRIGIFKDNLHIEATASKFEPLGEPPRTRSTA